MTSVMSSESLGLRHVNPASGTLVGLAAHGAQVTLLPLPSAVATPASEPLELTPGPAVSGAAAASGDLFIPDPGGHRVLQWTACDGTVWPLACFGGVDAEGLGGLDRPVAAAMGARDRLLVADAGRGIVFVVDPVAGQLIDEWDLGPAIPIALAIDAEDRVYIGFEGAPDGRSVRRFDRSGREDETFAVGGPPIERPVALVVTAIPRDAGGGSSAAGNAVEERLVVLNAPAGGSARLLALDVDGGAQASDVPGLPATIATDATAFAIVDGRFFVGTGLGVVAYAGSGVRVGLVADLEEPVRALIVDCHGHLLALAGSPSRLIRISDGTTWTTTGSFRLAVDLGESVDWHHLDILGLSLPPKTHVRLFTCSTAAGIAAPPLGGDIVTTNDLVPASPGRWRAHPTDTSSMRVIVAPGGRLSIAGTLEGDGSATPTMGLIRVAYDRPSWLRFLPAMYERDDVATRPAIADPDAAVVARERAEAAFLERALAFVERSLEDSSGWIDDLPILYDAGAAPDGSPPWLDWLAGWLALDLAATWTTERRRAAVAAEFDLAGIRGTARGLRQLIEADTGIVPTIDEPASRAVSWSLGETSVLGFTTMVAPAEAAGAVLDTTAIVDGSHLIDDEEYGSPLYEDLVGRVCIRIRPPGDRAAIERRVRALLDVELPAHVGYHLCVTEAAMRVGAQSQVGIDSIVAGPPPDLVADGTLRLGLETVLPALPGHHVSLGTGARVGHDAVVQ
jgi:phage tail-like protein